MSMKTKITDALSRVIWENYDEVETDEQRIKFWGTVIAVALCKLDEIEVENETEKSS